MKLNLIMLITYSAVLLDGTEAAEIRDTVEVEQVAALLSVRFHTM